jgi:hypothetical protein
MHFVQAKTRLPEGNLTHCKLGYFLTLEVGLYLPLNFTRVTPIADFLPQIVQTFSIDSRASERIYFAILA